MYVYIYTYIYMYVYICGATVAVLAAAFAPRMLDARPDMYTSSSLLLSSLELSDTKVHEP